MSTSLPQRCLRVARRTRISRIRATRSYASGHHEAASGHAAPTNETLGPAFYIFAGALPASFALYYLSRASETGEASRFTTYINQLANLGKRWEERNHLHTAAIEQAAQDRHLFNYAERSNHVDLRFPEVFQTGSQQNVPAGHYVNLDKVINHYRQQHLDEEEKKATSLAARAETGK